MQGILIRWFVLTAAITIAAYLIEGIRVSGFLTAVLAAVAVGFLNVFFRPILLILTLPLNLLTLGLFTFVINALLLKMASGVISGFHVEGFWSAVWGAVVVSAVSWLLNTFITDRGRVAYRRSGLIEMEQTDEDTWEQKR